MNVKPIEKFQSLLRDLFQFDCADLDFGIYRIMNQKRQAIERFIGEEVYLWANHDQYYIKTGEFFTEYSYKAPNDVTVHFKLQQMDVEQNNVKGEKCFFLPVRDGIAWDETARTLTIPFRFRLLTDKEQSTYGQNNQQLASGG